MDTLPKSIIARPWPELALVNLADTLSIHPWTLVEFWSPDCLFSRLLAPTRTTLAARYGGRLTLLRCEVQGGEQQCATWRVSVLPAVVLFNHGKYARRWIGAIHVCLLTRVIDEAMGVPIQITGEYA